MADLFQIYWYPIYAYIRRRGYGEHVAEDLAQGFCLHLQEKHALAKADRLRGKFGVTRERIRQLQNIALSKLRRALGKKERPVDVELPVEA